MNCPEGYRCLMEPVFPPGDWNQLLLFFWGGFVVMVVASFLFYWLSKGK